jgi:hypothetical protein
MQIDPVAIRAAGFDDLPNQGCRVKSFHALIYETRFFMSGGYVVRSSAGFGRSAGSDPSDGRLSLWHHVDRPAHVRSNSPVAGSCGLAGKLYPCTSRSASRPEGSIFATSKGVALRSTTIKLTLLPLVKGHFWTCEWCIQVKCGR